MDHEGTTHAMDIELGTMSSQEVTNRAGACEFCELESASRPHGLGSSSEASSVTVVDDARSIKTTMILSTEEKNPNAHEDHHPLPPKHGSRLGRFLSYGFFSTYRKTFTIIFAANLLTLVVLIGEAQGIPSLEKIGTAVSVNIMVSLLFRQEHFVNLLFIIFTDWVPLSLPLVFRRKLAKVFHYGGVHSGCSVAAVAWYLVYTVLAMKRFVNTKAPGTLEAMVTSNTLMVLFITMLVFAYPGLRARFHDHFEMAHRFAGWTVLGIFWVHTIYEADLSRKAEDIPLAKYLINSANFWCLCISTVCIFLSWSALRLRSVRPEALSKHAARWHFDHAKMRPFCTIKVSTSPVLEWHGFVTIPTNNGKGFSLVVANAGDWTGKHIAEPLKKLWIRGYPQYNLLYSVRLFRKIIVVATGSGIGPCLSLFSANIVPLRVLWSTRDPQETYGDEIMNAVLNADPHAVIVSTRPRPDMVKITHQLYTEFGAEAVFVVSNPKGTKKLVYGMESRGIAAYGAIFDS